MIVAVKDRSRTASFLLSDDSVPFHAFDEAGRPIVANPEVALDEGRRSFSLSFDKLDGNSLAFYVPQSHQVLMKTMHSRNIPETPALLFANLGHLRKFFYIRPEQGGSVPRQGLYALELIPRKPDRHLSIARITVDMGTGLPRSITFTEFNGTEIAIDLVTLHPLSNIANRSFRLPLPPGTTVFHTKGGF